MKPHPWLHGLLEHCLLALLAEHRDYGLGLIQRIAAAGLGDVAGGTLYPALLRLETAGLVRTEREQSRSGPPRKYFELTAEGERAARESAREWASFRSRIDSIIAGAQTGDRS